MKKLSKKTGKPMMGMTNPENVHYGMWGGGEYSDMSICADAHTNANSICR